MFGDYPKTTFDSHVTLVRANDNNMIQYLFYAIKYKQAYLMGMGKGSTNQLELGRDTIKSVNVLVPTESVLNAFECIAQPIHDKIKSLQKSIFLLTEARERLLSKLISGELEV